jgi:hypothetical protein
MKKLFICAFAVLSACAKKEEAPAADAAPPAASVAEAAPGVEPAPVEGETIVAETEDAVAANPSPDTCPVLDSRNWTAWTAPDGAGHMLTIEGEVDMPTPGYALSWREGPADRAMPPGLRVHLDAAPPADLVMQVVTPTPVSYTLKGANPAYRVVYVLCGGEPIGEIADVGSKG